MNTLPLIYRTLVYWLDEYILHRWLDKYLDPLWGPWRVKLCNYVEHLYYEKGPDMDPNLLRLAILATTLTVLAFTYVTVDIIRSLREGVEEGTNQPPPFLTPKADLPTQEPPLVSRHKGDYDIPLHSQ